ISAGLIRERLGNPYKAYRFRTNPVLYEQSKRIDPNIKEISDYVVNKNNSSYNCAERNIGRDNFDFILEKVGVKMLNGMYKFSPAISGSVLIPGKHELMSIQFLSVLRYKKNIHITFHDLS